jgi:aspartate/methionine/tyrosine aminotransferase
VVQVDDNFANEYRKQVLSCVFNDKLLNHKEIIPEAKEKAKYYLQKLNIKIGAYSESRGILGIRRNLVKVYQERDNGAKVDEDDIYLTNGGNNCYDHVVNFITNPGESILVPNPCYPLFHLYNTAQGLNNVFYDYDLNKHTIDVIILIT